MYCTNEIKFKLTVCKTGTFTNSENPDEMPHNAAFH